MKQFIIYEKPNAEGLVRLTGKDYKYLVSVRRIKVGQGLPILLGGSVLCDCKVFEINSNEKWIELKILDYCAPKEKIENNRVEIILLQWLIKGQRMDLAVRQATEAGIAKIFPVFGEFSVVKKESSSQIERRQRIIREARQQSGSLIETEIFPALKLEMAYKNMKLQIGERKATFFMLSEKDFADKSYERVFFDELKEQPDCVVLAIGCEGGISPFEQEFLMDNNFKPVHFDTNILRAETAVIYSIAAVQTIIQFFN